MRLNCVIELLVITRVTEFFFIGLSTFDVLMCERVGLYRAQKNVKTDINCKIIIVVDIGLHCFLLYLRLLDLNMVVGNISPTCAFDIVVYIFMPLCSRPVYSRVLSFIRSSTTIFCKHVVLKTNEPTALKIGTSGPRCKARK